jgi:hypothetical protein
MHLMMQMLKKTYACNDAHKNTYACNGACRVNNTYACNDAYA